MPIQHQTALWSRSRILALGILVCLLLGFFTLVTAPLLPRHAPATTLVTEVAQMPAGQASPPADSAYEPTSMPLLTGNSDKITWLRLRLSSREPGDYMLTIGPAFVQRVEIFAADPLRSLSRQGLYYPNDSLAWNHLSPTLPVRLGEQPLTLLVRIQSSSSYVTLQVTDPLSYQKQLEQMRFSLGMYLGSALIILVASLGGYLLLGGSIWLRAIAHEVAIVSIGLAQLGFTGSLIFNGGGRISEVHANIIMVLMTPLIASFHRYFLVMFQVSPALLRVYRLAPVVALLGLGLLASGHDALAMRLNNAYVVLLPFIAGAALLTARHDFKPLLQTLRLTMSAQLIYILLNFIPQLTGLGSGSALHVMPPVGVGYFSLLIYFIMLSMHAYNQLNEAQRNRIEKQLLEADYRAEQAHRKEVASLLGLIMHEVKGPLSLIRMVTFNLKSLPEIGVPATEKLERIERAVSDIDHVLEKSMEVDGAHLGRLQLSLSTFDPVQTARELISEKYADSPCHLTAADGLRLHYDEAIFSKMLDNLLNNAVKYSPENSPVFVHAHRQGKRLCISVSNEIGSAGPPDSERLFSKYYRSDGASGMSGSGIGLHWVYLVLEKTGDSIHYDCVDGRITFRLEFSCSTS